MRNGIAVAGNIILDDIKMIDVYPGEGMLCSVLSESYGVGGCVPNTGISLKKLDPKLKVCAYGRAGTDDKADYVLGQMEKHGMDVSGVIRDPDSMSSYTDVMTVKNTGARTFFHARGANARFSLDDLDFKSMDCKVFHIGYALLLDKFDEPDDELGTVLARALRDAKAAGLITSMDVVSENSDRFKRLVTPCIKHCDYVIINEIEGGLVSGIPARGEDGKLIPKNLRRICEWFVGAGTGKMVCLHFPEGGVAMTAAGEYAEAGSLVLPKGYIQGSVGAGDSFCAGMLYSLYNGFPLKKALEFAGSTAACNLSRADSVSGIRPAAEVEALGAEFPRRQSF